MRRWRTNRNRNSDCEIAHVLFIDIVGYSKLRTNEQSAQMEKLREIVRGH